MIQTDGSTSLTKIGNQFFVLTAAAPAPALRYGGALVVAGEFGAWTPIAAVQTATGYEVAWTIRGANTYTVWSTDSSGNYLSDIGAVAGTVIQTDGSTSLTKIGNQFFVLTAAGPAPRCAYGGALVVAGEFGAWTPIAAVQTATGYEVAWTIRGANTYTVWSTDSSGNYLSDIGAVAGTSSALESLEPIFGQDLNGDGVIGLPAQSASTNTGRRRIIIQ